MISVYVQKTLATAKSDTPLTSGSVGTIVQFYFSSDWEGLNRTAVFETSAHQKETAELNEENSAVIPESVMAQDGVTLFIGVYGTNEGGSIVVPTVYANCGEIKTGANTEPGGEPVTPSQAQQLQNQINDLDDRVDALEAGGGGSGGGAVTSVNGQTGTVVLNAEDVGALPDTTQIPAVPAALPNPNKLIFTGAVNATYDGSEAVSVEIPQGGGEAEWQTILTGETTVEAVTTVTIPMTASDFDEYRAVIIVGKNTDGTTTSNNTNILIDGYLCAYYMLSINYGNYDGTFSISVEPIPETGFLKSNGDYTSCAKKSTVDWWMTVPYTNGNGGTKVILCENTEPTGVLQIKFGTAYSGTIIHEVMAR